MIIDFSFLLLLIQLHSNIYIDLCNLSPDVKSLTLILAKYLDADDINELNPFDVEAEKKGCKLYEPEVESKYCINCGHEFLAKDDIFCTECGVKRYGY